MSKDQYITKFIEDFCYLYQQNPSAFNDIKFDLKYLQSQLSQFRAGVYEDQGRFVRKINQEGYSFISAIENAEGDRAAKEVLKCAVDAFEIINVCRDLWQMSKNQDGAHIVSNALRKFGLINNQNYQPGFPQDRGHYVFYRSANKHDIVEEGISMLLSDQIEYLDGIDQNGPRTNIFNGKALNKISNNHVLAYNYKSRYSVLGSDFGGVINDRDYVGTEHRINAKEIFETFESGVKWLSVRYSNGNTIGMGRDNEIMNMMENASWTIEEAKTAFENQRILNVGMQPLWGLRQSEYEGTASQLIHQSPEIGILSINDMFAPSSKYLRGIIRMMQAGQEYADEPAIIFYKADSEQSIGSGNKIHIILNTTHTPSYVEIGNKTIPNVGSHGFVPYLASFGLFSNDVDDRLKKAGDLILQYINNELDLSTTTLKEHFSTTDLKILPLDKSLYRENFSLSKKDSIDRLIVTGFAQNMAKEYIAMGCRHPILKHNISNQSLHR